MLTNSCSPSKMKDGWIYSTYCPIFRWNVDEPFWTNRRILGRKRETWTLENLRNFEYDDHGRKKRTKRTVKFDDICRSRQEVSKEYLMVEVQLMLCWIHTDPAATAESGSFKFWEQKTDVHLTRRSSSGDEYSSSQRRCPERYQWGPVQALLRADIGVLGWDADE